MLLPIAKVLASTVLTLFQGIQSSSGDAFKPLGIWPSPNPSDHRFPSGYVPVSISSNATDKALPLPVYVNGRKFVFEIDTGASMTIIDAKAAHGLGLKHRNKATAAGFTGKSATVDIATANSLQVGDVFDKSVQIAVADISNLIISRRLAGGEQVSGLIGADFLDRHAALIDYRNRRLYLKNPWAYDRWLMRGRWQATSLTDNGHVIVDEASLRRTLFTYDGYNFTLTRSDGRVMRGRIALGPHYSPKIFRLMRVLGDEAQLVADDKWPVGLYDVSPGRLRIMIPNRTEDDLNRPIPTRFASNPVNGMTVVSFERAVMSRPSPLSAWPVPYRHSGLGHGYIPHSMVHCG